MAALRGAADTNGSAKTVSDLRIDITSLREDLGAEDSGRSESDDARPQDRSMAWAFLAAVARATIVAFALAVLPFVILIRGGVFAYQAWGLGTWPSLLLAAGATAVLLGVYAWVAARWVGIGGRLRTLVSRGAVALGLAYVAYGLVFIASGNVKSADVRAEYAQVHPLLRVASSALILVDPASVLTDAGRTVDEYRLMGLPPNEASLHFVQEDGFSHAIDFRTVGRPEWRNRMVELCFWALGFHALRHVGTADHLHVSLRPPAP